MLVWGLGSIQTLLSICLADSVAPMGGPGVSVCGMCCDHADCIKECGPVQSV